MFKRNSNVIADKNNKSNVIKSSGEKYYQTICEYKFDSEEEYSFYLWLLDAKQIGLIEEFEFHPEPFLLCESKRMTSLYDNKVKTVYRSRQYTPDFKIKISNVSKFVEIFKNQIVLYKENFNRAGENIIYIDIKGNFQKFGEEQFIANQKWVNEMYGIYVYKILPDKVFQYSWIPELFRYTPKSHKLKLKYSGYKLLDDIIKEYNFK